MFKMFGGGVTNIRMREFSTEMIINLSTQMANKIRPKKWDEFQEKQIATF